MKLFKKGRQSVRNLKSDIRLLNLTKGSSQGTSSHSEVLQLLDKVAAEARKSRE